MKLKAFTLVETLITVLVVAVLSSVGIFIWDGTVDDARQRICGQNQYLIEESLKMYIYEKDAVPVSLSSIVPEFTDIVIAKIGKENIFFKPTRNIYLALIAIDDGPQAWAAFSDYTMGNKSILRCPAKKGGGISYAYNIGLDTGNPKASYRGFKNNGIPIVCDSDSPIFSTDGSNIVGAAFRHTRMFREPAAIACTADGIDIKITSSDTNYENARRRRGRGRGIGDN